MGSNMQRQAVPCLRPEKAFVGTGIERTCAIDSGTVVRARRGGKIDFIDCRRIVIRVNDQETSGGSGVDIYNLIKYMRSNQNTNINQRPLVETGRCFVKEMLSLTELPRTWASLPSVKICWLPLCHGMVTTLRTSILISEKVVSEDRFTSIHIEELSVLARDTKLGSEEITRDISNLSEAQLGRLDESGVVYIGAEVEAGDVLVGKVTPKGETQLTPEEKLLRGFLGKKHRM